MCPIPKLMMGDHVGDNAKTDLSSLTHGLFGAFVPHGEDQHCPWVDRSFEDAEEGSNYGETGAQISSHQCIKFPVV